MRMRGKCELLQLSIWVAPRVYRLVPSIGFSMLGIFSYTDKKTTCYAGGMCGL